MDDQQDSSTGMIIAIVAGGVILALIVLAVLGAGFWFVFEARPVAGPVPAPAAVVVEEGPVAVEQVLPGPVVEKELSPQARRFLGEWETTQPDGTKATMFFGVDGRLRLMKQPPAADAPDSMTLRWEIVESKGDRIKVRYASDNKAYDVQQDFEFLDDNRFVIRGPFREDDRWVAKGPDGTAEYRKR